MLIIILAAGKGTRMKSGLPKVLHPAADKPMLWYSIETAKKLNPDKIVVVVGSGGEQVKKTFSHEEITFCTQTEQKGTADAVLAAGEMIEGYEGQVLILCGDMPDIQYETISSFIKNVSGRTPAFITVKVFNPAGYGRVVRAINGQALRIVEEKDANPSEKKIKEINTGVYLCEARDLLERLREIKNDNAQGEYYLTDIITSGCTAWVAPDEKEFLGVNDRYQLAEVSRNIWNRRNEKLIYQGVTMFDPFSVYLSPEVVLEEDVTLYPNVYIQGKSIIKKGTLIYPGVRIVDSVIEENCVIKENTLIEESRVGQKCNIGPMAHLRPGTDLAGENSVGNYVELKKAELGRGVKANHLTYLGDCRIGEDTNIGCGTITCNYDGFKKHHTEIGKNVFIGSDVQLVAPVTIGDEAIVGAGTTVTEDVPAGALALSRTPQMNMEDKAKQIKAEKSKK